MPPAKREGANAQKVEAAAPLIRAQYTRDGRCLHNDLHALAKAARLGDAEVVALEAWLKKNKMKLPVRPKAPEK